MIKKFLLLSFLSIVIIHLYGQEYNAMVLDEVTYPKLDKLYAEYKVFELNTQALSSRLIASEGGTEITLKIGDEISMAILLESANLFGISYYRKHQMRLTSRTLAAAYKGWIEGVNNSNVRLTIGKNFLYGYINTGEKTWYIEPVGFHVKNLTDHRYILHDGSNMNELVAYCGTKDDSQSLNSTGKENSNMATCQRVEIAVASDFSMVQRYGSVSAVENRNIAVMNVTQGHYTAVFSHNIEFEIVTQFVSDCSTCDPWTSSNNIDDVLTSFTNWGNGDGFGVQHDLGQFWTDRDFDGSSVGLAWIGAVCRPVRYNVCQTLNDNIINGLLSAHELGHNFGMSHDPSNTSFIMSPSLNPSTMNWSSASVADGNAYISTIVGGTCLEACGGGGGGGGNPPISSFMADQLVVCSGSSVQFSDMSSENPTTWSWQFDGGNPSSSNLQNPAIVYSAVGSFDVMLTTTNTFGSHTASLQNYIQVQSAPVASFTYQSNDLTVDFTNSSSNGTSYIWRFDDGATSTMANPSHTYSQQGLYNVTLEVSGPCGSDNSTSEIDLRSTIQSNFTVNQTSICTGDMVTYTSLAPSDATLLWSFEGGNPSTSILANPIISYEFAGSFTTSLTASDDTGSDNLTRTDLIQVSPNPIPNFTYMVQGLSVDFTNTSVNASSFLWDFGDGTMSNEESPNHTFSISGQFEVTLEATNSCGAMTSSSFVELGIPPIAMIGVDKTDICQNDVVQYTNETADNVNRIQWIFEGGIPTITTDPNPRVRYPNGGVFRTSLLVTNEAGSDELILDDLINVTLDPIADFDYTVENQNVNFSNMSQSWNALNWDFGDGVLSTLTNPNHSYQQGGTYVVNLKATNQCGEDEYMESLIVSVVVTATSEYQKKGITVFPNPTAQHFFLTGNGISPRQGILQLIDFNGKIQKHYNLSDMAGDKFSLGGVSPGLYLILLKLKDGQFITHILVE